MLRGSNAKSIASIKHTLKDAPLTFTVKCLNKCTETSSDNSNLNYNRLADTMVACNISMQGTPHTICIVTHETEYKVQRSKITNHFYFVYDS